MNYKNINKNVLMNISVLNYLDWKKNCKYFYNYMNSKDNLIYVIEEI